LSLPGRGLNKKSQNKNPSISSHGKTTGAAFLPILDERSPVLIVQSDFESSLYAELPHTPKHSLKR